MYYEHFFLVVVLFWQSINAAPSALPFEVDLKKENTGVDGNALTNVAAEGDNIVQSPKPLSYNGPPSLGNDRQSTTTSAEVNHPENTKVPTLELPPPIKDGGEDLLHPVSEEAGSEISNPCKEPIDFLNFFLANDPLLQLINRLHAADMATLPLPMMNPFLERPTTFLPMKRLPSLTNPFSLLANENAMKLVKTNDIQDGPVKGQTKLYDFVTDDPNTKGKMLKAEMVDENGNRVIMNKVGKYSSSSPVREDDMKMLFGNFEEMPTISNWFNQGTGSLPRRMHVTLPRFMFA